MALFGIDDEFNERYADVDQCLEFLERTIGDKLTPESLESIKDKVSGDKDLAAIREASFNGRLLKMKSGQPIPAELFKEVLSCLKPKKPYVEIKKKILTNPGGSSYVSVSKKKTLVLVKNKKQTKKKQKKDTGSCKKQNKQKQQKTKNKTNKKQTKNKQTKNKQKQQNKQKTKNKKQKTKKQI